MVKRALTPIKKKYYNWILQDKKTVEVRPKERQWKNLEIGDILLFQCGRELKEREILKVHKVFKKELETFFRIIDFRRELPNAVNPKEVVGTILNIYPNKEEFIIFEFKGGGML